jgi:endoglucanase
MKKSTAFCCALASFLLANFAMFSPRAAAQGAALQELSPIHAGLLMLHFSEGSVRFHGLGELAAADRAYRYPLNVAQAGQPARYAISSPDDANYASLRQPVQVGRKSKGKAFSGRWPDYPVVREHFLYLELPYPLQEGKAYIIQLDSAALGTWNREIAFVYEPARLRSEAIHLNQLGYEAEPGLPKYAYVYHWAGDRGGVDFAAYEGAAFQLIREGDGAIAFSGQLAYRGSGSLPENSRANEPQNYTRAEVWECDFTAFAETGEYRLSVEGIGASYLFRIGHDRYREAFYHTARALYHQRAGSAKDNGSTPWAFPRDHHPDDGFRANLTSIRDLSPGLETSTANWAGSATGETVAKWGWYHDAGDWDPYPRHVYVANYLLTVYELFPDRFRDGELDIPESGNGIPDILDEAAWVIHYLRRTTALSPSGGVLARSNYAPPPARGIPSWADPQPWYATNEDPSSTFIFAAGAAQLAYNLDLAATHTGTPAVADSSAALLQAAREAFAWSLANSLEEDTAVLQFRINRLLAAIWLYKSTGEAFYQDKIREWSPFTTPDSWDFRWMEPIFGLATCPDHPNLDAELRQLYRAMALHHAEAWMRQTAAARNLRMAWDWNGPSFVGLQTTPQTLPAIVAYALTGDEAYRALAYTSADFNLGANPLNMCWITGLGQRRPDAGILHLDSWYYEFEGKNEGEVIPGIVPYAHHVPGMDFTGAANGPHNNDWALQSLYPPVADWPLHETWQHNRQSPRTGEFTINQNIAKAAAVYGFLCAPGGAPFQPRPRPHIAWVSQHEGQVYAPGQAVQLAVEAWADGGLVRVEFYANGLPIGQLDAALAADSLYALPWPAFAASEGEVHLAAVAYNRWGDAATARALLMVEPLSSDRGALEPPPALKIYPNPARAGRLQLELPQPCPEGLLRLAAADGRLLDSRRIAWPDGTGELDISRLGPGLLLIAVRCGEREWMGKVVVE